MTIVGVYANLVGVDANYRGGVMRTRHIRSVDTSTGEILDGVAVWVGPKVRSPYGQRWYMQSQDAVLALATDKELAGRPLRVLLYLLARLDFENYIQVPQADISRALELHKSDVTRAVQLLEERGIIIRGPKVGRSYAWRLNPTYGWKGKARNLRVIQGGAGKAKADAERDPNTVDWVGE